MFQKNLKVPSDNTVIWRYLGFEKFLHLIIEKKLFLCRLDKLTDMFEGTVFDESRKEIKTRYKKDFLLSPSEIDQKINHDIEQIHKFRKFTLVNCWSMYNEESFALWKIYTKPKYGIAIKSTFEKLKKSLCMNTDLNFGVIDYNNDKSNYITQTSIPLTKKPYYQFEKELRVILYEQFYDNCSSNILEFTPICIKGKSVDVNVNTLIDSIYLSPTSPEWFKEMVYKLVIKFINPNFKDRVFDSNIKDDI